ncbi:MAG TPA: beta-N-acetylglucosaminidase domain-containing protein [Acidimicrobiales bacterium]|nr:beta-N-acetylglucosaminidase domain-containing protein [Acidimicrobiales bacterium]
MACSGDGGDGPGGAAGRATTTSPGSGAPILEARSDPLPVVTPTPREMRWLGPDVPVPSDVDLIAGDGVDAATTDTVTEVLRAAGARNVRALGAGDHDGGTAPLVVDVGTLGAEPTASPLGEAGVEVPGDMPAEGYALAAFTREGGAAEVVLAGADAAGTFYAAQTLRQLLTGGGDGGTAAPAAIAGVGVVDRPAMRHRGAIEGFYGSPWTQDERLDQLDFYGRFKLNTYVYAPKDDPYHRDRWREPYPPELVTELQALIDRAAASHVRFTFAVSPGVSICYSDPADLDALVAKLDAVYRLGARAFSIALDDIVYTRWNCDGDRSRYGAPSSEAAARAQVELLNTLQRGFIAQHEGAQPLQMVPTEYRRTDDSPYRRVIREQLDPAIEVMWTGSLVVPAEITVDQATAAAAVFGRPTFVWDNTPVNDFPATEGRLILAPYARRQPGLSAQVTGIVLNPMNQAAASKVQLVGAADFTWNDAAYDPMRAHRGAATYLAGGSGGEPADPGTVDALLAFFDVENFAPTSAPGVVSQPQAPALAGRLDAFRGAWDGGDRSGAVGALRPYAQLLAGAPAAIDRGVVDRAFIADARPWLDATALWGQALVATLDALDARIAGDGAGADARFSDAAGLADRAGAIQTIPGETRPQGPVRVADGVLDDFIADAPDLS